MHDATTPILAFLNAAAAKQPAPGGGSVSALVGALAASMGEMVLNYSVHSTKLLPFSDRNQAALDELTRARSVLLELMVEDQQAYQAYADARKQGAAPDQLSELLAACIRVPQAIGTTALAVLEIANRVAPTSNKYLLSDLAVCGELAMATVRCAIHNVRVNLADLSPDQHKQIDDRCLALLDRSVNEVRRLIPAIHKLQLEP